MDQGGVAQRRAPATEKARPHEKLRAGPCGCSSETRRNSPFARGEDEKEDEELERAREDVQLGHARNPPLAGKDPDAEFRGAARLVAPW